MIATLTYIDQIVRFEGLSTDHEGNVVCVPSNSCQGPALKYCMSKKS